MPMFDPITNFRFWCHKIIPLVYDESLSYYEFLCKVMQKLNEVIDTLNEHSAEIERFETDILAQFEAFRIEIRERITAFENLFVGVYSTEKNYLEGDIVTNNNKLYVATDSTSGDFDPTKWDEIIFADYFVEWRRELSEEVIQFVTNITNKLETWLSNIASEYNSSHEYTAGDIVKRNDLLYIANTDTTGTFDLNDWDTLVLCDWLADIIRRYDEALDSISVTVNNCEKRKANITDTNIVSKSMKSASVQGEQTGYYLAVFNLTTIAGVTVFVINFNGLGNNTPANKAAFIESMNRCALGTTAGPNTATAKSVKWYNECGIVSFTTSANTGVALWFYNDTVVQNVGVNITQYDLSNIGTSFKAPIATEQGAGFADVNNLATHYDEKLEDCESSIGNAWLNLENLLRYSSHKYTPETVPPSYSGVTRHVEWYDITNTTTGGAYYYYEMADIPAGDFSTIALMATLPVYGIGVGTTADDALGNITAVRFIDTRYARFTYVLKDTIKPSSGDKVYVFYASSDVDPSIGVSGTAYISTGYGITDGSIEGFFGDLPTGLIADWLDKRVCRNESQLGGTSIVPLTEAEYAQITPDSDTLYFAY